MSGRVVACIDNYEGLVAALRRRTCELRAMLEEVDAVAGLTRGHTEKLLAHRYPKKFFGDVSLPSVLGALGLKIALVEDEEQTQRVRHRLVSRCSNVRSGPHRIRQERDGHRGLVTAA